MILDLSENIAFMLLLYICSAACFSLLQNICDSYVLSLYEYEMARTTKMVCKNGLLFSYYLHSCVPEWWYM